VSAPLAPAAWRRWVLIALIIAFAALTANMAQMLRSPQAPGADYSCFWAGVQAALHQPSKLYDFDYISGLQGWPLGRASVRPFIYPPSALAVFMPFAVAPYWVGYTLWNLITLGLMAFGARRIGAPWWFLLVPYIAFVVYCGQVTFLIGGLVLVGLSLRKRPILAGIAFGVAAAIKPQMLILLPVALIALKDWKTIAATAATGLVLCLATLPFWGAEAWLQWIAALGRFQHVVFGTPALVRHALTPYAALEAHGLPGAWAFLLSPVAVIGVWAAFRREMSLADRSLALFGATMLISPYAMNYEAALFAPAVAVYLTRTSDRAWPGYVVAAMIYATGSPLATLLAPLALPVLRLAADRWPALGRQRLRPAPRSSRAGPFGRQPGRHASDLPPRH
jgi:hypothetical protein